MVTEGGVVSDLFLRSVRFKDFRTFGSFETQIVPAPGLTLLVGTNGLGKSSFFDALEWGLTGEVRRFKSYMGATDQGKYLTRRGAVAGSHFVGLGFSDDTSIDRGPDTDPHSDEIVELLKKPAWTAQIQDIATYLAFTHFLGQAAQQRFTSRDRSEQWESLKGPSGIERLDEVRRGLRGRATELAFNRRTKRETQAIEDAERLLSEWQELIARSTRLRDAAETAGALPSETFAKRLDALAAAIFALEPDFADDTTSEPGVRLTAIRKALEDLRRNAGARRTVVESLSDIPTRYATELALADESAPPLVAAREAERLAQAEVDTAVAAVVSARGRLDTLAAAVTACDRDIAHLESIRFDLDAAARAGAELLQIEAERTRVSGDIDQHRVQLTDLEKELSEIQQRIAGRAGLSASSQAAAALGDLARQLPALRAKAGASAAALAGIDAATARTRLSELSEDRNRLVIEVETALAVVQAARDRASRVTAAVAVIASHLHDEDQDCPVCRSHFEPGQLRLVASELAGAQDATLAAAERQHADLTRSLEEAARGIAEWESVLRNAELARTTAEADAAAVADLEGRLAASQPNDAGDFISAVLEAERQAAVNLAAGQAADSADRARIAEATAARGTLQQALTALETTLSGLNDQIANLEDSLRKALERVASEGRADASPEALTASLTEKRDQRTVAERDRVAAEETLRRAIELEAAAQTQHQAVQENLRRLTSGQIAASEAERALIGRWRDSGFVGLPTASDLEAALARLGRLSQEIERLEDERTILVSAHEVAGRDQELADLLKQMSAIGGEGADVDPTRHEAELGSRRDAARTALALTETAHAAVEAFADKLRDEAAKFSTQFLTPLNGLIGDFNEALLSTPGETVQLNAAYHKDRTQFDMGLHYRDPLDDAIYDTGLPPQVVLSEGQLAANGFSILCSASTAYPWSRWRALLMDDPLQHNDIIHAAAFVDLMRNLVELQGYQLVMSSHDRGEAEFIRRKFDAAGLPCSVIALTAPSKAGVRYLPPDHNSAARNLLAGELAQTA